MKKLIILTALFGLLFSPAMAQKENSEKEYLPKEGEFSIGFDLYPAVNFIGNAFNFTSSQSFGEIGGQPTTSIISTSAITQPTVSIVGRYMLTDDIAIRANIGLMITTSTTNSYVVDDAAAALDPLLEMEVIDSKFLSQNGGAITIALEKRIGKGRVQGVFSGGLVYGFATSTTSYSYGNAVTELNQNPSSSYSSYSNVTASMPSSRMTSSSIAGSHSFGLATSAGIEWFVAPKISIGLEVNLIAVYGVTTGETAKYEGYNTFTNSVETYNDLVSPASSSFTFGTENIGGNLGVHFYF